MELLVAAALCVVVMYVLAEAFKAGTDTLSQLKSVAGLSDQLRVADTIIHRDLKEQHLEDKDGYPVLVSNLAPGVYPPTTSWTTPNRGYFRIIHPTKLALTTDAGYATAAYKVEGSDGNGIPSAYATNHWMQFTCKLPGKSATDIFLSTAPTGAGQEVALDPSNLVQFATTTGPDPTYAGQWGEVTYFLKPSAATMPSDVQNPKPLHVLYRRARVMAPPGSATVTVANTAEITGSSGNRDLSGFLQRQSSGPDVWVMNTPDRIADPQFRLGAPTAPIPVAITNTPPNSNMFTAPPLPFGPGDDDYGADILLTNVVSMRILPQDKATLGYNEITTSPTAAWPAVWDTFLNNDAPNRILGVRVQLRVYDTKNMVTRQITIDSPL